MIEVKLFERKKKFEELIAYEGNIGSEDHFSKVHCRNSTTVLHFGRRDENCDPNSFDFDSYSSEFEEELSGKEELIELLKQKNRRLSTELEGLHRRCVNLQNIVCGESTLLA